MQAILVTTKCEYLSEVHYLLAQHGQIVLCLKFVYISHLVRFLYFQSKVIAIDLKVSLC